LKNIQISFCKELLRFSDADFIDYLKQTFSGLLLEETAKRIFVSLFVDWEHEISHCCFSEDSDSPALIIEDRFDMPLTTMHGQSLLAGGYELQFDYHAEAPFAVSIIENGYEIADAVFPSGSHQGALTFQTSSGVVELVLSSEEEMNLHGLSLSFKP